MCSISKLEFLLSFEIVIIRNNHYSKKTLFEINSVVGFSSGSVIVGFIIHFKSAVDIYSHTRGVLREIIVAGLENSLFKIDKSSVHIQPNSKGVFLNTQLK